MNLLAIDGRYAPEVYAARKFMLVTAMAREIRELALIERIRTGWGSGARNARSGIALGIGDDCAILRSPRGHEVLVTTDFTLEGRHFRRDWHTPESAGHRCLARGLSDLAAMGARPLAAFLSLALPGEMIANRQGRTWVKRFFVGMRELGERFSVPLAGGDTAESPAGSSGCGLVLADIVLVGSAPAGCALRRSGGRAGDSLYVTGELGGAAAELRAMERNASRQHSTLRKKTAKNGVAGFVAHPQMFPEPRIAVGLALLQWGLATSAIDLSDGLSTDIAHLCRESGVGAEIELDALPIHPLARRAVELGGAFNDALRLALDGGEDYELLFAAPASVRMPRSIAGVKVTRIGQLVRGGAVMVVDGNGRRSALKPGGWQHFAGKPDAKP
jgi:thiamine-monophosphate kinase